MLENLDNLQPTTVGPGERRLTFVQPDCQSRYSQTEVQARAEHGEIVSLLLPSGTKAIHRSLLVATSYVTMSVVVRGLETPYSLKWAAYKSSVSLIRSVRSFVLENALGSIL